MTIRIETTTVTLGDGSKVFNLVLSDSYNGGLLLPCITEHNADALHNILIAAILAHTNEEITE